MGVIAANWQAEGVQLSITLFKRAYSFSKCRAWLALPVLCMSMCSAKACVVWVALFSVRLATLN